MTALVKSFSPPRRPRGLRRRIEETIEFLMAKLDELDGDPDAEEDDPAAGDINDEPHDDEWETGLGDPGGLQEQLDGREPDPDIELAVAGRRRQNSTKLGTSENMTKYVRPGMVRVERVW